MDEEFLWLEDVEGEQALTWVKDQNQRSLDELTRDPRYDRFHDRALKLLTADDRVPFGTLRNGYIYNFWQDEKNVRGIWRRTGMAEYRKDHPKWEILIDFDELAKKDNENWVYKGVDCLPPEFNRCLVKLSRGGKDATVVREFDLVSKSFIKDGFQLPEAKSSVSWMDQDHLLVGTEWSPGEVTNSGYPLIIKKWKRGTPLSEAKTLFEGQKEDVMVYGYTLAQPGRRDHFLARSINFYESEIYWLSPDTNEQVQIPIPTTANIWGLLGDQLIVEIKKDWKPSSGGSFAAGSLLAFSLSDWLKDKELPSVTRLFEPTSTTTLEQVAISRSALWLSYLDNVQSRVVKLTPTKSSWARTKVSIPEQMSVWLLSASSFEPDLMLTQQNFITPNKLFYLNGQSQNLSPLKSEPSRFDASGLTVRQEWVKSKDGTRIPYFIVHKEDIKRDGSNPTLLYGYGGFEVSYTPYYSKLVGKLWLERGGVYVLANIRGGGEFGPRWHQAALKENRQRAFDDFIAVGEDLVAKKITSPEHLGISGGSNGGLLVGAVFTQRPDLMNAVICSVPLLDMIRYHKLLAGASWMAEYGDPEDPEMRKVLLSYSPYHQLKKSEEYPKVLFITSTKDDRVHPAHARRMAAKMESMGHSFLYYENMEGGHGAAANLKQTAKMQALEFVYLSRQLWLTDSN